MVRSTVSKIMWVGRATVFMVGLAVVLALVFGVATAALGTPVSTFKLGQINTSKAISTLVGAVPGSNLKIENTGTGANATALELKVDEGNAPLAVNADAGKATNLDADKLDGQDSTVIGRELWAFIGPSGNVIREHGVIVGSTQRVTTGQYLVVFDRDVTNCAYVGGSDGSNNVIVGTQSGGNPNEVFVQTKSTTTGAATDSLFHLIVAC